MIIKCVWEHNGDDSLLYSENFIGAFTRGQSKEIAIKKMKEEIESYLHWKNEDIPNVLVPEVVKEKKSDLHICDADSDVIFDEEVTPLTKEEYFELKDLALKSADDFLKLYKMIPDKNKSVLNDRKTFYGSVPRTASEMYEHTKNVNSYYFGEINVSADNEGTIYECRKRGFEILELSEKYLDNIVHIGSYNESWSLRKVIRRFVWHDRIHAKAMYRMAIKTFGDSSVDNIFRFNI